MPAPLPPRSFVRRVLDGSASRTVFLWGLLVVLFIVFFQWFQMHPPAPPTEEIERGSSWGDFAIREAPLVALFVVLVGFVWRIRRFNAENKRGIELMAAGSLAPAAEVFRRLSRAWVAPTAVARLNLGIALLRLGELDAALESLAAAERSRWRWHRPLIASFLALCNALEGELDAADAWVAESRHRASSPNFVVRIHVAAEAITRLRRGDAAGAARLLEESWGELERSTAADMMRALRIVRAFAAETAGSPGQVADLLAGARPFRAGEYAWLGARWPEMARYLATNGFAQAA